MSGSTTGGRIFRGSGMRKKLQTRCSVQRAALRKLTGIAMIGSLAVAGPIFAQQASPVQVVADNLVEGSRETALDFPAAGTYQIDVLPGVDVAPGQNLEFEIRRADGAEVQVTYASDPSTGTRSRAWLEVDANARYTALVSNWAAFGEASSIPFLVLIQRSTKDIVYPEPLAMNSNDSVSRTVEYPRENDRIFQLTAPQSGFLKISLKSEDSSALDPTLALFTGSDDRGELLATNDDSEGTTNSLIIQQVFVGYVLEGCHNLHVFAHNTLCLQGGAAFRRLGCGW